jgi:hypothetical protein
MDPDLPTRAAERTDPFERVNARRTLCSVVVVMAAGLLGDVTAARDDPPPDITSDAALATRTGVVQRYLTNEFGDVDGILATDATPVRFPPHMSRDLVAALKPGDRFVARGRPLPGGGFQAYSLGREGTRPLVESRPSIDGPPPPPDPAHAALAAMTVDGRIVAILRGPAGDADGIVIDDGSIVKLPPHSRIVAADALRIGMVVHATGYGTGNRYGRSLRAEQIGFDGRPPVPLQPEGPRLPPKPPPPAALPGAPPT